MDYLFSLCQAHIYHSDFRQQRLIADKARKHIKENNISFNVPNSTNYVVSSNYPLFEACRVGYLDLAWEFIYCGASLNVVDEEGRTPLYVAISSHRNNYYNILKLIQWGADVNLYKFGKVPLLSAFYGMDSKITKLLICNGADVNNVNLPSFCFIESLFALNSGMVMMAAGVRFHFENFEELLSIGTEIVLAGLTPRTFYLSGRSFIDGNLSAKVMSNLWKFQYLCLSLGFRVDLFCLQEAIFDLSKSIQDSSDAQKTNFLKQRLERLDWTKKFLMQPLSLTFLSRIAIRSYLVSSKIRKGKHVHTIIDELPLPILVKEFLTMRSQEMYINVLEYN
ncbi:hypothetical protein Btru_008278 [Bulinus truncatus]|nr:hypothetical protein Btru_008278 [Bulinus truncatus]